MAGRFNMFSGLSFLRILRLFAAINPCNPCPVKFGDHFTGVANNFLGFISAPSRIATLHDPVRSRRRIGLKRFLAPGNRQLISANLLFHGRMIWKVKEE
jgi:hypothetical protein